MNIKNNNYFVNNKALLLKSSGLLFYIIWFLFEFQIVKSQNHWTAKTNFGGGVRQGSVSFVINGKGYVSTGKDGSAYQDLWEYNVTNNSWTQKANFGGVVRSNATGVASSTKGYVGLGISFSGLTVYQDFWEYDPIGNSWTQKANFAGVARSNAVAFSLNEKVYMGTGSTLISSRSDFYEYNPSNNTWTSKASYDGGVRSSAIAFSIGNYGYIGCGTTGLTKQNDFWQYNPIDNSWTQKTSFGGSTRTAAVGFNIYNKGYIATGNSLTNLDDMYEYDPSYNTWLVRTSFPGGVRTNAIAFSIDAFGYLGTGNNISNQDDFYQYTSGTTPSVNTISISVITGISASSGGNVMFDGTYSVTDRGLVWSTSSNPTVASYPGGGTNSNGTGTGSYTSSITGLSSLTTYYVRAYATNSAGTSYGEEVSFTTTADYPTLISTAISSILSTTANSGGNITSDGGDAVSSRGVVWNTSTSPIIALLTKTSDGTGSGVFSSSLTGLTPGTLYYVRAYATNGVGTSYGNEVSFTTDAIAPTLTSTAITSILSTTASSGGNITSDGGDAVSSRGVVWNTSTLPIIALSTKTSDGTGSGVFSSSLTGLIPGTLYYVRAYATNSIGTSYGNEVSFTTNAIAPTLTSTAITSILSTTASSGGNITSDGGDAVTSRGVVWSSFTNSPTISTHEGITSNGNGVGVFVQIINSLCPGTTYYVRSYATNSIGTSYGNLQTFTTNNSSGDIWIQKANFSGVVRNQAVMCIIGSKIYYGTGTDGGLYNDFWEYDINSNVWTQKANFLGVSRQNAFSFSSNTKVYIGGGTNGTYQNDFYEYDPTTNTWVVKTSFPSNGLSGCVATSYSNNGYVGLGIGNSGYVNEFWRYNTTLNTWTNLSNYTGTERYASSIFIISSNIYINCGYDYLGNYTKDNYMYDIINNTWIPKADNTDNKFFATSFSIGNKGYLVGGNSGVTSYDNLQEYDPITDKWIRKSNSPNGTFSRAAAIGANNKGYLLHLSDLYEYNPSTIRTYFVTNIDELIPISGRIIVNKDDNFNGCISQAIIDKGIVWDINPNPTIIVFSGKYSDGSVNKDFIKTIEDLSHTTQYYIRSYTQTIQGVVYGNEETFTTPSPTKPFFGTTSLNGVGDYTASIKHSIISDGYSAIIESGIIFSTNPNPTIVSYFGGNKINTSNTISNFNKTLFNLIPQTQYYLKSYSTNIIGTTYSNEISFFTQSIFNDDDNDGIDDNAEDNGPNDGDGNGDGIPDNLQANVASFFFDEKGNFITLEAQNCASLNNIKLSKPESSNEWLYPFGVVEFSIPCDQVDMKIYYHGIDSLNNYVYRKTDATGAWETYKDALFSSQIINGKEVATVIFPLRDGGIGDGDGVVNGQILDPGGPAISTSQLITNIPTLSEWARIILVSLLVLFGGYFLTTKKVITNLS